MWVSKQILSLALNFTGKHWRERSSETLQVNGGDFITTWASGFWTHWNLVRLVKFGDVSVCQVRQKWIAVIQVTRRQCLQVILRYPDHGNDEYVTDPRCGENMCCTDCIYCQADSQPILLADNSRFNRKYWEIFALLWLVQFKEESSFIVVCFEFIHRHPRLKSHQAVVNLSLTEQIACNYSSVWSFWLLPFTFVRYGGHWPHQTSMSLESTGPHCGSHLLLLTVLHCFVPFIGYQ